MGEGVGLGFAVGPMRLPTEEPGQLLPELVPGRLLQAATVTLVPQLEGPIAVRGHHRLRTGLLTSEKC